MSGQGIVILFGKPADREDEELVSQKTILPELEFRLLLYEKVGSKVTHFLVLVSLQRGCVHFFLQLFTGGLVRMFPVL